MSASLRLSARLCAALFGFTSLLVAAGEPSQSPTPGALESTPEGWTDLLTDPSLGDWERAPFPAGKPLGGVNPWSFDPAGPTLRCEAVGIHEMLLHRVSRTDGVLHVEWRYIGSPPKPNSGVFVRTSADASVWMQAQLSTTGLGMIFGGSADSGGKPVKHSAGRRDPGLRRPDGEWNVLELTCRGPEVRLWINGQIVATLPDCPASGGRIGLEAEFNPIEFRRILFRPLP